MTRYAYYRSEITGIEIALQLSKSIIESETNRRLYWGACLDFAYTMEVIVRRLPARNLALISQYSWCASAVVAVLGYVT